MGNGISCPYCHRSEGQVRAGTAQGKQRFKCVSCRRRYVDSPAIVAYPETLHERAALLHRQGTGIRAIARDLGVNHQTVANWLQQAPLPELPAAADLPPPTPLLPPQETAEPASDTERKRPTINDVALRAGVSTSTISNYLNERGYIRTETAERIRAAIDDLHFTPNALVRAIRQRRTNILGVLMFGITELDVLVGNSLAPPLLSGINLAADKAEYNVLLYPGWLYRPHRHPGLSFLDGHIDGLLWVAPAYDEPVLEQVARAGLPMVALLTRHVPPGVGYVNADNAAGTADLVQHLHQRGHERIGWIGPAHSSNFYDRLIGYRQGLESCGLAHDPEIEFDPRPDLWLDSSYQRGVDYLMRHASPPTAIVVPDDGLASGVIQHLQARGLRVPEDVAVTGFNDIPDAHEKIGGGLTTVRQPFRDLGEAAVNNLLKMIAGARGEDCRSTLPAQAIARHSTETTESRFRRSARQ